MRRSRFRMMIIGTVAALLIANLLVYDYVSTPPKVEKHYKMQTPKDPAAFDYLFGEPDEVYHGFEGPIPDDEEEKKG